jgi:apolipoprotein N-acyltransferase
VAEDKELRYNSALQVPKNGRIEQRYDKMHRVPWGEFVPWRDWLPFMKWLSPYDFNYDIQAGKKFTRFELGKHKYGVLICYEDTDPFLPRRYVRDEADGGPVDFLLNISNDGWFDGTVEHEEHLAISRFRAIECRRAIAKSVNMGISAVIDSNGRVLRPDEMPPPEEPHTWKITGTEELPVAEWASYKKTAGVLLARVPIDNRGSFYAATGDWLPIGCGVLIVGVVGWAMMRRRQKLPQTA